jgi:hypothetical protein
MHILKLINNVKNCLDMTKAKHNLVGSVILNGPICGKYDGIDMIIF